MNQHRLKMMYKMGFESLLLMIIMYGIWTYISYTINLNQLETFLISLVITLTSYGCWYLKKTFLNLSLVTNKVIYLFSIFITIYIFNQITWEQWSPLKWVATPYQLRLVLNETGNPKSLGSEIWFESIQIDNQIILSDELIDYTGWFKVGNGYTPFDVKDAELIFEELKDGIINLTFLKTPYSGIIDIYKGAHKLDTIDLYSKNIESMSFSIPSSQGVAFWLMQLGIGLFLIISTSLVLSLCILLVNSKLRQSFFEKISLYFYKFKNIICKFIELLKLLMHKYDVQLISIWMGYGIWTIIDNLFQFSDIVNCSLLVIIIIISLYLYKSKYKLLLNQSSIRQLIILLSLLITMIGFKYPINSINQPLKFLVPTYDLTIVTTTNKNEQSLGNEAWITDIYINRESQDFNNFNLTNGWNIVGNSIVNSSQTASTLTIPNLSQELVELEFLKSSYSGEVEIYHNDKLINKIDLYKNPSANLQIKASPDYLLLLLMAKIGFVLWGTFIVSSILSIILKKIENINVLHKLHKNGWINKKYGIIQLSLQEINESDIIRIILYSTLSIWLVFIFYYLGYWTFRYEWMSYLIFFIGTLLLEKKLRKKWSVNFLNLNLVQWMKKFKLLFYGLWFALLLTIVMGIIYYMPDLDLTWYWLNQNVTLLILTATLIVALFGLVFSSINHGPFTIGFVFLSFVVFGIADYLKRQVAGEPLYPADLAMITKIDTLLGYLNGVSPTIIFVIMGILISGLTLLLVYAKSTKLGWKSRIVLLILSVIYTLCFINYEKTFLKSCVKSIAHLEKWNQISNYNINGSIIGFISNLQNDIMEKPAIYSQDIVQRIVDERKEKLENLQRVSSETPNIIVVVSESFSDPLQLSQLTFSEDPIPTVRYYQSQGSSGYLLSPFKGGSTANVEFEFLTGLSNSFLTKGAVPFQQSLSVKKSFPSIVSYFNKLGYETVAVHPNNTSFYKRNQVYPNIGFEKFIGIDDLTFTNRIANQLFISDEAVMNELLAIIKNNEEPSFIYGLTIQNHLPIEDGKFGTNTIMVQDSGGERIEELETYVQGLKLSDESLNNFMKNIEELDEPTIVIFFGDHLINFESSVHYDHGYVYGDNDGDLTKMFYQTPLFIWSNKIDLNTQSIESISPNFLMPIVIEALNLPMTPYYQLLLDVYDVFGALHPNFKLDRDENNISMLTEEQKQLLLEYELIQYDLLQGKGYSLEEMFTPIDTQ